MFSKSPHPDTTPVVRNVWSFAHHLIQQECGSLVNSQLPHVERRVCVPAVKRDTSQGGSSVASTIQGQNSTPSSSLKYSCIADITQHVTSTPSATQRGFINTPTAMPGSSSCSTLAPGGTSQTDSKSCNVSCPASGIVISPTHLSSLENLTPPISNPEAGVIMTNPLRMRVTEKNHRHRQWKLQPPVVLTLRTMVSSSHRIDWLGHSDMTPLVFATGGLLELYMWNRWPFMSAKNLETVSNTTQHIANALGEAPLW